jgi:hypothetical protein
MSDNVIATPVEFAKAGLALLKNKLVFAKKVSRQYSSEFARQGAKIGDTVKAKRYPEFVARRGRVAQAQDVLEGSVPIKLDIQTGVDYKFTSIEDALTIDSLLMSKSLASAMSTIAQDVDSELALRCSQGTYSWAGTPGQTINSATDFFKGPERLADMSVPDEGREAVLSVRDAFALAGSFTSGVAIQSAIAQNAVEQARIPMIAGVQPVWSQSIVNHKNGTWTGGAQTKGAGQEVDYLSVLTTYTQTILIDDLSNGATIKVGDKFTFTGVKAVNRRTKQELDYDQQFTVRAPTSSNASYNAATETYTFSTGGSSEMTIEISPPIIISGAYQTVSAALTDDHALALVGSANTAYAQNLVFQTEAFALVTADLPRPFNGEYAIETDPESGLSIRYWRYSDGTNDEHNHRYDLICGVAGALDPRLSTIVSGTA